jgi:hypothetical protein
MELFMAILFPDIASFADHIFILKQCFGFGYRIRYQNQDFCKRKLNKNSVNNLNFF